jgi:glycosyltransferase involved in cell wall biosynthesis
MVIEKRKAPRIIAYRGDRAACWFYRLHAPLIYVARHNKKDLDITVAGSISKNQVGKYDFVILQRQYKEEVLEPVLDMQYRGAKLVYEIDDDLFHIPEWNPAHRILGVKKVQDGIKKFISKVDAMFVTTDALREVYKNYCKKIYVLPNSIDYETVYPFPPERQLPVVCWQGSMTHEKDVEIAKKGFNKLAQDKDLIFKMWSGFKLNEHGAFTNDPIFDIPGVLTLPLVPFEAFFQMFGQVGATIGLAPLAANQFNRCKSNLKFLEYTAYGAVTVASNFGPYKDTIEDGHDGILVSNNAEWYDATRAVIEDAELRVHLLKNATEKVSENYDISKNYILWEKAIYEILGREKNE